MVYYHTYHLSFNQNWMNCTKTWNCFHLINIKRRKKCIWNSFIFFPATKTFSIEVFISIVTDGFSCIYNSNFKPCLVRYKIKLRKMAVASLDWCLLQSIITSSINKIYDTNTECRKEEDRTTVERNSIIKLPEYFNSAGDLSSFPSN